MIPRLPAPRLSLLAFRPIALVLGLALAPLVAAPALACGLPPAPPQVRAEVIALVNAERQRAGLGTLRPSPVLDRAAQTHACDMANRRVMSHRGGDGSNLMRRVLRAGYNYRHAGENIAQGFRASSQVVTGWMGSTGHRRNILARQYREVGVGVIRAPAPDNRLHWVIVFGAQL